MTYTEADFWAEVAALTAACAADPVLAAAVDREREAVRRGGVGVTRWSPFVLLRTPPTQGRKAAP